MTLIISLLLGLRHSKWWQRHRTLDSSHGSIRPLGLTGTLCLVQPGPKLRALFLKQNVILGSLKTPIMWNKVNRVCCKTMHSEWSSNGKPYAIWGELRSSWPFNYLPTLSTLIIIRSYIQGFFYRTQWMEGGCLFVMASRQLFLVPPP